MFAYTNNGFSFRGLDNQTGLAQGEVFFDHVPTEAELEAAFSGRAGAVAATAWSAYQQTALAALAESDKTVLRCGENQVQVPAAWATYRKALRTIVSATSGDPTQPLPTRPAYPANT